MEAAYKKFMDTKIVVEKALKGEDFANDIATLTSEDQAKVHLEIKKAAEDATKAELNKLTGLQKAVKAVTEKNEEKESNVLIQFKNDQISKAKAKFFADPMFKLDDAGKEAILKEYEKSNSGSIDADLIFADLKKCYGALHSEELLSFKSKTLDNEKNAANFNAAGAGASAGAGGAGADSDKYSKAAKELYQDLIKAGFKNKTLADAQKMVDTGAGWKDRKLS